MRITTPTLRIYECEGHGRYFETYEGSELHDYGGTFEHDGVELCRRYGGRLALVYGYDAYEAACLKVMEADPEGWDVSAVEPEPVLVMVRTEPMEKKVRVHEEQVFPREGQVFPRDDQRQSWTDK